MSTSDQISPVPDLKNCRLLKLDSIPGQGGILTVVQNGMTDIPFDIRRIFYLHNLKHEAVRGGHAHIASHEIIIPVSGGFTLVLDDGCHHKSFVMTDPQEGMYVAPGIWRTLSRFEPGTVVIVLSSELYSEEDYIRDYTKYIARYRPS